MFINKSLKDIEYFVLDDEKDSDILTEDSAICEEDLEKFFETPSEEIIPFLPKIYSRTDINEMIKYII